MLENFCGVDTLPAVTVLGRSSREVEALAEERGLRLEWTPCHYGGRRPWLVCPRCGRRRAKLYPLGHPEAPPVRGDGLCRRCLGLGYLSQRLPPMERWARQAQRIRERLGGSPDLALPFPRRPARMPRKTYARLRRQARDLWQACYDADLFAWARMADQRDVSRSAPRYWQARERFLATYAPSMAETP